MINEKTFLERAHKAHGNRYLYGNMNYKNYTSEVTITCPIHGDFTQIARDHASKKQGCPICGIERRAKKRRDSKESFINKAIKKHGDYYNYSAVVYKGSQEPVTVICPKHGPFKVRPDMHIQGTGCQKCGNEKKSQKLSLGEEEFKSRSTKMHNGKYDYSLVNYKNQDTDVDIICPIHGKFTQKAEYHMNGSECPECAKISRAMKHFLGNEDFIKRAEKVHNGKYNYSKTQYTGIFNEVTITCPIHGDFTQKANDHLCGCGCQECGRLFSKYENEIYKFIRDILPENETIIRNDRIILLGNELDLYIPERKFAIEFDGLFWHNEINKPDKKYHLNKTELCEKRGIKLIHIFEDEWVYKQDIVKGRLKSILGLGKRIYARKCTVAEIDSTTANQFINENHIQGKVGGMYHYGLYYNGELVGAMSFGKTRKNLGRKNVNGTYELLRYCSSVGCNIIGGASKLLQHFIRSVKPRKIISYADRRWSSGNLYEHIGFRFVRNTEPSYYYVLGDKRKNRFAYRKNVLIEKYGCSKEETEHSFCLKNHWYRIYDCGTKLYEMDFN